MLRRYLRWIACFIVSLLPLQRGYADPTFGLPDTLSEQGQISLLVSAPSPDEVYTLYGHAALRILDPLQGIDVSVNYGIFNFSEDFLYRFVKGETDYIALPVQTQSYMEEYLGRGSEVTELVLALDSMERAKVWEYLLWNVQPEHRVYRYNFFYDNCATRPLSILERAVAPARIRIRGAEERTQISWRDLINAREQSNRWLVLGTDLCLGAPTDALTTQIEQAFLPDRLLELLTSSSIVREGIEKPLVLERRAYAPTQVIAPEASPWSWLYAPELVMTLLLIWCTYRSYRLYRGQNRGFVFDGIVFALLGLGGSLLCYLAFVSVHPHTSPNYNLWVMHPLHLLVGVPAMILGRRWRSAYLYHFANFVVQLAFILFAVFLPQHFNPAVYLLSLSLLILSGGRLLRYRSRGDSN